MRLAALGTLICTAHLRRDALHDLHQVKTAGADEDHRRTLDGNSWGALRSSMTGQGSTSTSYVDQSSSYTDEVTGWPDVKSRRASQGRGKGPLPSELAPRAEEIIEDPRRFDPIWPSPMGVNVAHQRTTSGSGATLSGNSTAKTSTPQSSAPSKLNYTVNRTAGPDLPGFLYEFLAGYTLLALFELPSTSRDRHCAIRDELVARFRTKGPVYGYFGEDNTWLMCLFAYYSPWKTIMWLVLMMLTLSLILSVIVLAYYANWRRSYWSYYGSLPTYKGMAGPHFYFGEAKSFYWADIVSLPSDPGSGYGNGDTDDDVEVDRNNGPLPPHFFRANDVPY